MSYGRTSREREGGMGGILQTHRQHLIHLNPDGSRKQLSDMVPTRTHALRRLMPRVAILEHDADPPAELEKHEGACA